MKIRVVRVLIYEGEKDKVYQVLDYSYIRKQMELGGISIKSTIVSEEILPDFDIEDFTSDKNGRILYKGQVIGKGGGEDAKSD